MSKNTKMTQNIKQNFAKASPNVDFAHMAINADSPMESMSYLKSQLIIKNINKKNVSHFLKTNTAVMAPAVISNTKSANCLNWIDLTTSTNSRSILLSEGLM
jgi:hypothetical protein